jgi:uncharacterized protein YkwD
MRTILRAWFGCVAVVSVGATTQAQTYYYYPSSVTAAPGYTTGQTTAPTYYYRRGLFGRVVRSGYSPQFYQTAAAPQVYQTTVAASAPVAQTPAPAPAVPASDSANSFTPVAAAGAATAAAPAAAPPVAVETGDPYGFLGWLNATRAAYGLPAVGHDPNLSSWAAENNNHQAARGMGHFVMGPARRQNSAVGSISNIGSMWMNSPAHRAALLDPTIRWMGIAGLGAYWTFNAN